MSIKLQKSWMGAIERTLLRRKIHGFMGKRKLDGNYLYDVNGKPGFVWVTIRLSSGGQTAVPANNIAAGIKHAPRLAVELVRENNEYIVVGRSTRRDLSTPETPDPTGVGVHSHGQYVLTDDLPDTITSFLDDASALGAPVDTDEFTALRGGSIGSILWSGIKTALTTLFDGLYVALTGAQNISGLKSFLDGIYIKTDGTNAKMERTTTATGGSLRVVVDLRATSTGSVADGFGPALFFSLNDLETGAVDNFLASLGGARDGADNTGKIIFRAYKAGVSTVVAELNNNGQLTIFGNVLGGVVERLQSVATNDDPTQDFLQGRIATTDATVTTLFTMEIPASHLCFLQAFVMGYRTGGAAGAANDCAVYEIRGAFVQAAGAAVIAFQSQVTLGENQAAWNAVFDVTGTTARIRVTGAASNNITWHAHVFHRFFST